MARAPTPRRGQPEHLDEVDLDPVPLDADEAAAADDRGADDIEDDDIEDDELEDDDFEAPELSVALSPRQILGGFALLAAIVVWLFRRRGKR